MSWETIPMPEFIAVTVASAIFVYLVYKKPKLLNQIFHLKRKLSIWLAIAVFAIVLILALFVYGVFR